MTNTKNYDSLLTTIIVEGATMEPSYLKMLEDEFKININIIAPENTTHSNWSQWNSFFAKLDTEVINNINAQGKQAPFDMQDNDVDTNKLKHQQIGVVNEDTFFIFDTENRDKQNNTINPKGIARYLNSPAKANSNIQNAIKHIKSLRDRIFFSNPMFEFWIALHFNKNATIWDYHNSKQGVSGNTIENGRYDKTNIKSACEASEARYNNILKRKHNNDKMSILTETDEAFSEIHILINELKSIFNVK